MEQTLNFAQISQNIVLHPSLGVSLLIFGIAFINEIIAIFPYTIILAGNLLIFNNVFTVEYVTRLLVFVALPVALGSTLSSLVFYALAYYGGKPAIEKYHKFLHFNWSSVEKINARFKGAWYDEVIFLVLRSLPLLPSMPIDVASGILRMRLISYFVLTLVGFVIRMMLTIFMVGAGIHGLSEVFSLFYN